MNAKKIMGAVLVALLAAALFVGAGAAADGDSVYFYKEYTDSYFNATWTYGTYSFTLGDGVTYVSNTALPEGKYTAPGDKYVYLKKPTATITGIESNDVYIIGNGGNLYQDDEATFTIVVPSVFSLNGVYVTQPNGVIDLADNVNGLSLSGNTLTAESVDMKKGQYKIEVALNGFVTGAPDSVKLTGTIFTFNVVDAGDITITPASTEVLQNEVVAVTITGKPGVIYNISGTFDIESFGTVTTLTADSFKMPNTGSVVIYVSADSGGQELTVTPMNGTADDEVTLTLEIIKGSLTAETDKESYFIGNKVTLTGTSTVGSPLYFYWEGTNVDFQTLNKTGTTYSTTLNDDKTWEYELGSGTFQFYDAGTYTVYVSTTPDADEVKDLKTYATVSLVLKQPFISITDAPAVAVTGSEYVVTGTAEAATDLYVYIFGTNFFEAGNKTVAVSAALGGDKIVSFDKNTFEVAFTVQNMSAGQYFMVIQHPMYDKVFNIAPAGSKIVLNETETLFTVDKRQTANAAQALCDALDTQNIDDMYVKLSFVVAAPTATINPIPSEITQGSKLTVSGTTNMGADTLVTVEMISTAFAAVPKETVGSASFIALTTKTDKDGNWEITFDTTGLNVDEYTVSVAVGSLTKTTAKVNVIEGAPTEQPTTQPTETEQPTTQPTETEAPTTPGFGALAALAGLGAVAVLLLRRE